MRSHRVIASACVAVATTLVAARAQDHQHPTGGRLGTVHFETSCAASARPVFDQAMALLHSFEFGPAIEGFSATLKIDPACAMAHWAVAIARWSNPFAATIRPPSQLQQGLEAIARARAAAPEPIASAPTSRQRRNSTMPPTNDQRGRVVAYEQAMAALAAAYPSDREATIFWALALTASALPADKSYVNQLKAGALLEKLFPEQPDHPGITHYIIHSYDVPALADRARDAARRYAAIAPDAPHALHMPSHTFTRVGAWQDSIETNIASAAAARRIGSRAEELHAMDYQAYAYLQTGQDEAAKAVLARLPDLAAGFDPTVVAGAAPGSAGVFALAAMPARWALERRDWLSAAHLVVTPSQFPYADALTHFARALGSAETGALDEARRSIRALETIETQLAQAKEAYWAEQVAIQHQGALAFLAFAEGRTAEALQIMRRAAVREDATEKNAVTPGPLAPARELLGDMLLGANEPAQALAEFQTTLKKEPNRFRAVYGAAKAAELAGNTASARAYHEQLLSICERADSPGRRELVDARKAATKQ